MRARIGLLLPLLLLLVPPAAAEEVPLRSHGGALAVEATVNRRFTGLFLLDTGATYCVLSAEAAREAKIRGRVSGRKIRLITGGGEVEAALGEARRVDVGGASSRDVGVAVTEEDPAPGFDGVLGLSFLGQFTYTVDAQAGVLRLGR